MLFFFHLRNVFTNVYQSGFRPGHSTITASILVVNDLVNALDIEMEWAALDLSKDVNTVDHNILLNMLSSIGLSFDTCSWFHDYLNDRTQSINQMYL